VKERLKSIVEHRAKHESIPSFAVERSNMERRLTFCIMGWQVDG